MEQLLLWKEPLTEEVLLKQDFLDLKEQQNNLRRGLFQRFKDLQKEVIELKNEIKTIKKENLF